MLSKCSISAPFSALPLAILFDTYHEGLHRSYMPNSYYDVGVKCLSTCSQAGGAVLRRV